MSIVVDIRGGLLSSEVSLKRPDNLTKHSVLRLVLIIVEASHWVQGSAGVSKQAG